ncbi:hypothetical protein ThvES_00010540 [Thiovulum sp. ES]|nr:hypothetical protein ThvES_00010540 [Thiovulum sp. ES]
MDKIETILKEDLPLKTVLKTAPLLFIPLAFQGCLFLNERGVASHYYNDCTHYYDSRGIYHNKCEENIVNYEDVKNIGQVMTTSNGDKSYYIGF